MSELSLTTLAEECDRLRNELRGVRAALRDNSRALGRWGAWAEHLAREHRCRGPLHDGGEEFRQHVTQALAGACVGAFGSTYTSADVEALAEREVACEEPCNKCCGCERAAELHGGDSC